MLGVSCYLGERLTDDTKVYLSTMNKAGFKGIFTSLQIPEEDESEYLKRLSELGEFAKGLGMNLTADISNVSLKRLGFNPDKPEEILNLGLTGLRLDYGFDHITTAFLSRHMNISLNACTVTPRDILKLRESNANFDNVIAWHNFFPRPETGLSEDFYLEKNKLLKNSGFKIAGFVPGNSNLRGPLYERLPTLEKHRYSHPLFCAYDLAENHMTDHIYIGDPRIDRETIEQFSLYFNRNRLLLHASIQKDCPNFERILGIHKNRIDQSRDVIRFADSRIGKIPDIKPFNTVERLNGSITIDNNRYGRYMGEIQIALKNLPQNDKVNVYGKILPKDIELLSLCRGGQEFEIRC